MIKDLIEQQGMLIAVNEMGQLLLWNINKKNPNQPVHFPNNVSILPSQIKVRLDQRQLLGVVSLPNHILAFNRKTLFLIDLKTFTKSKSSKSADLTGVTTIVMVPFLNEKQSMKSLKSKDGGEILIGTDQGNLFVYNIQEQKQREKVALSTYNKKQANKILFATRFQKPAQITSILLSTDKSIAMVSLDNGKIFSLDSQELRIVNEVTSGVENSLERINKIYLREDENKVYSLHDSYIIQWNYKLNLCLGYIECQRPQGLISQNNSLLIINPSPNLTIMSSPQQTLQLSMRGASVIHSLGNDIFAVGGADNLIDIFKDNTRLMTLIPQ